MLELAGRILSIILIDLVLSGDDAVVIGMAARRLPPHQRRRTIIFGGGAAIGLRILHRRGPPEPEDTPRVEESTEASFQSGPRSRHIP